MVEKRKKHNSAVFNVVVYIHSFKDQCCQLAEYTALIPKTVIIENMFALSSTFHSTKDFTECEIPDILGLDIVIIILSTKIISSTG